MQIHLFFFVFVFKTKLFMIQETEILKSNSLLLSNLSLYRLLTKHSKFIHYRNATHLNVTHLNTIHKQHNTTSMYCRQAGRKKGVVCHFILNLGIFFPAGFYLKKRRMIMFTGLCKSKGEQKIPFFSLGFSFFFFFFFEGNFYNLLTFA